MAGMYLRYLDAHIQSGSLYLHLPNGTVHAFGQGDPHVDWFLHTQRTLSRIMRNPARMLGETYVRGEWDVNVGQLSSLLSLLLSNITTTPHHPLREACQRILAHLPDFIHHSVIPPDHAELDEWLLKQFLDGDLHYACAYFNEPDISLEQAQRAKCRHLMHKLRLRPGQHILDLNADWGGLPLFLAEHGGVKVTAVVRSHQQLHHAQQTAQRRGLSNQVTFLHKDYRQQQGKYDRIIVAGLIERLSPGQYSTLFSQINSLLSDDGIAVLQSVGRLGPPGSVNPWIRQQVLPHHYNPALSELSHPLETSGLVTCDVEVLQQHFAPTLAAWQLRFQRNRPAIAHRMGERFCRLWEFYLAACEAGFESRDLTVFELQLARHKNTTPATRDYLNPAADTLPEETQISLADLTGNRFRTER